MPFNSSIEEIKKAYRIKARMYHPDINPLPESKEKFIQATEAYEFLLANHDKGVSDEEAFRQAMEEWRKYRQDRARQRAYAYAQDSYNRFRNSKLYKTTRIFDATRIIYSLILSVLIIVYTIFGYVYRLRHPVPYFRNPNPIVFILLLLLGMSFFIISLIYLKAYLDSSKKHRKKQG